MENWENFLLIMMQIKEVCNKFLALGKEKQEILISGKTIGLDEIVKQEEALLLQLSKLEDKRQSTLDGIIIDAGIKVENPVLSEVEKIAAPSIQNKIYAISADIKKTMTEISGLNQLNSKLIQQALFLVNCNINLLIENRSDQVYGKTNNASTTRGRMLVDQKV